MQCWVCRKPLSPGMERCRECGALQPARWQYHIVTLKAGMFDTKLGDKRIQELNDLGQQGWELAGVVASNLSMGATGSHSLLFKRRIL